jgi:hypothetical protein
MVLARRKWARPDVGSRPSLLQRALSWPEIIPSTAATRRGVSGRQAIIVSASAASASLPWMRVGDIPLGSMNSQVASFQFPELGGALPGHPLQAHQQRELALHGGSERQCNVPQGCRSIVTNPPYGDTGSHAEQSKSSRAMLNFLRHAVARKEIDA